MLHAFVIFACTLVSPLEKSYGAAFGRVTQVLVEAR